MIARLFPVARALWTLGRVRGFAVRFKVDDHVGQFWARAFIDVIDSPSAGFFQKAAITRKLKAYIRTSKTISAPDRPKLLADVNRRYAAARRVKDWALEAIDAIEAITPTEIAADAHNLARVAHAVDVHIAELRAVYARLPRPLTPAQAIGDNALQALQRIQANSADTLVSLDPTFRFMDRHRAKLLERIAQSGAVDDPQLAQKIASNPRLRGLINNLQGSAFERYVLHWYVWKRELDILMTNARILAKNLVGARGVVGTWEAHHAVGRMFLMTKSSRLEIFDQAILLVERRLQRVMVYMALEAKAQVNIDALIQHIKTEKRMVAEGAKLEFQIGSETYRYALVPTPIESPTIRYVISAEEGALSAADITRLEEAGIIVHVLGSDMSRQVLRDLMIHFLVAFAKLG